MIIVISKKCKINLSSSVQTFPTISNHKFPVPNLVSEFFSNRIYHEVVVCFVFCCFFGVSDHCVCTADHFDIVIGRFQEIKSQNFLIFLKLSTGYSCKSFVLCILTSGWVLNKPLAGGLNEISFLGTF